MSVRFLIGRSGTGKTTLCRAEIEAKLRKNPSGAPLIYLVPDQMTFDSEVAIASTQGLDGMTRLNVFSFSRLALRVLQNVGGITRYHLSSVGISMLLRKIVDHQYDQLKVFQKASGQNGFYDLLNQTVTELKRYCITPVDLHRQWEKFKNDDTLRDELLTNKLYDLQLIYQQLELALLNKYIDSEDYLNLLSQRIHLDQAMKETEVWIDGFHEFTPQELEVIQKLMMHSKKVTIALTIETIEKDSSTGLSLFRQTEETYRKLTQLAQDANVEVEDPLFLREAKRFKAGDIKHLEQVFEKRPFEAKASMGAVELVEAVNRRAEVEHIARQVIKLVRDEGYRYREIAVVVRDLSSYEGLFRTIFKDYEVPIFLDQKRSMTHHPVVEFIRALLDIVDQNWRYDAVFRCIKTDLLYPLDSHLIEEREGTDLLENVVVAYGIHGERWKMKKPWIYKPYRGLDQEERMQSPEEIAFQKKINHLRMQVVLPISDFEDNMKKAKTIKEKCTVLYRFLEKQAIPEKIEKLRDKAETAGKLDVAREHDQVWQALIDLMDQLVETGGDESIPFDTFVKVMGTGLESMKFALVPPALDQLMIGSIDRSRLSDIRTLFILGANDGVFPAKPSETGLLSDDDRLSLESVGLSTAPDTRHQLLDEEFLIYRALTSPSERLIVSYPLATEEGKTLLPSSIIGRLKNYLTGVKETLAVSEPHDVKEKDQIDFITTPQRSLSFTSSQVRQWMKGYPISPIWWDAYNWFVTHEGWRFKAQRIMRSLFYKNTEAGLSKQTAMSLYGETIRASVSRMELFNSCPFSQFASYGLKLRERDVFRLEAPDIGQLFHTALSMISKQIQKEKKEWRNLTRQECAMLTEKSVNYLAPKLQKEILLSTNRHHYLKYKLQQVVERAVLTLTEHAKSSRFETIGLELPFGPHQPLPPLTFTLPNGQKMEIIGRIDRVDQGMSDQGILLRIIDYKSSEKDLKFVDIYYGLALQMLTYLDVVLTHSSSWLGQPAKPAGVLYFHVHNPMLQETRTLTPQQIETKLLKQFKMKGLVMADEPTVREMDQNLETGHSDILPIALKKDGSFYKSSSVITHEQMTGLREYVHQTIRNVGERITEGDISISPYKLNKDTPCQFCSYKSVCQFDQGRVENNYRNLTKLNDETILEKMLLEGGCVRD